MPCQVGDSQPPGELGRWVLQTQNAASHIARLHAANWGKYWLIKDHQRTKLSVRLNGKWKKKKTHNTDHFCIIAESVIFFPQLWSEILTFSLQIWLKSLVNSQTGCEFITQYWEHLGFFILLKWFFFFPPQMLHGARSVHYKWKVIPQKEIFYLKL